MLTLDHVFANTKGNVELLGFAVARVSSRCPSIDL
jgi:hypothetical protein